MPASTRLGKSLGKWFDPFVAIILATLAIGILVPFPPFLVQTFHVLAGIFTALLFFLYGARLRTEEVWRGVKNLKVQLFTLFCTFVMFPILGLISHPFMGYVLSERFALGFLFLTLLPSTVQASVSFTSLAGGDIPAAVTAATISNTLGMFLTPALVWLLMGQSAGVRLDNFWGVLTHLLLPFILGQLVQPWLGPTLRAHAAFTKFSDRLTIVFIVAAAVSSATAQGLWSEVTGWNIVALLLAAAVLLSFMLAFTWFGSAWLGLPRAERIVVLMCGSKKSLASGLPIAAAIFPTSLTAAVTIPVLVFHQFQLVVCAAIARRLGSEK
ncbi:hypothetical protein BSR29_04390 [Boudabousia liubingyangii]|uniref:Bile acid:sodium symporter n=1 Tax=Boudabousia liubingyangii TaxID=1921764 RepID=A0A1Q5PNI3_9ACTO|nr:bile acid:sodium symporter family protein [Boudabousia liubingyangii]OKL47650.1 hypothetical protein BSR28_03955 [Boudabousia liubingyangii]OKL49076.1 hypothetical protein BSR29_04390 [Boudabousia liubingyangii]